MSPRGIFFALRECSFVFGRTTDGAITGEIDCER
jgi:hypothetical protein